MAQIQIDLGRSRSWEGPRVATWGRLRRRVDAPRGAWRMTQGSGALPMPVESWRDARQGFRASPIAFR